MTPLCSIIRTALSCVAIINYGMEIPQMWQWEAWSLHATLYTLHVYGRGFAPLRGKNYLGRMGGAE